MSEQAKQITVLIEDHKRAFKNRGFHPAHLPESLVDNVPFAELVLNAQKAHAFDVMVERGWTLHYAPTDERWFVHELVWYPLESKTCHGSGPTPLAAVLDAEQRTKGGA